MSFGAFDQALWRTLAEHPALWANTDELNRKRIERGFAPYAPKSTWVGERREFELRYRERAELGENPFNLDRISITTPNSLLGRPGIVPAVIPWPAPPIGHGTRTPLVPPGIEQLGPTTLPVTPPFSQIYPGKPVIPVLPENETLPAVDPVQTGASIPGYPGDMDLPSPDALFYDRRDDPGMALGFGQPVSGIWLGEAARMTGAAIPDRIADQLRGREFANFHRFREAFWRAVAVDVELGEQFTGINLDRMRNGQSPYSIKKEQVGGRKVFELHHEIEISKGGDVYDVDNIRVLTPRRHIQHHREG
ncbi:hypothetical protein [Pseudomonas sp. R1-6]|uniref:hypothetical protein n=1 Tax=Pseudomonas sp. R1-6 TaxID=2817397 RepID=UPI003DA959E0